VRDPKARSETRSRGRFTAMEWGVVAIIAVAVVLAGSKLPQLARNVGRAQGEFKKGIREGAVDEPESAPATPTVPPVPDQPKTEQPPAE
jgi:sec-independent protein translocase protein TatA